MTTFARSEDGVEKIVVSGELVHHSYLDPKLWRRFRKIVTTAALRIEGPFTVETSEGPLHCEDGYLCVDARGYPYPVARDEFDLIYEEVS